MKFDMHGITIFINDLNDGQSALSASLLIKKLRVVADTPVGQQGEVQGEVLHLRRNNFRHLDMLGTSQLEKSWQKRIVSPSEHEVEHEPATRP